MALRHTASRSGSRAAQGRVGSRTSGCCSRSRSWNITLATVGVVWSVEIRRDKEAELIFSGDQIRDAIGHYRARTGHYPLELAELVGGRGTELVQRYLRHIYVDPMTGKPDWQLITAPEGGIMGVASTSQEKPIKVAGFNEMDADFEKAECYCIAHGHRSRHRALPRPAARRIGVRQL